MSIQYEGKKILGFIINKNGIESNSKNLMVLTDMSPPRSLKEVQVLIHRITALNRYISKIANKCLPFFKSPSNITNFEWKKEC